MYVEDDGIMLHETDNRLESNPHSKFVLICYLKWIRFPKINLNPNRKSQIN